jgi:hypothetical protein
MDPVTAAQLGIMVGTFVYHRWFKDEPKPERANTFTVPVTDEGSVVPLLYGKCLVRKPILAQATNFYTADVATWSLNTFGYTGTYVYGCEMLFALGIPFVLGTTKIHRVWASDEEMIDVAAAGATNVTELPDLVGDGGHEQPGYLQSVFGLGGMGLIEFLNGNEDQQLVNSGSPYASTTFAGDRLPTPTVIPGYRGYAMAFLFGGSPMYFPTSTDPAGTVAGADPPRLPWIVGAEPSTPAYSFEVSSYPQFPWSNQKIGVEANPIDVLTDLIGGTRGKAGIDYALIDSVTFDAAAETLDDEAHGFSMCIDSARDVHEIIGDILRQIDGVMYFDPDDGLLKIKLIRADFTLSSVPIITPDNCIELQNFAVGGWDGIVNKVRIIFTDRDNNYQDGSATAHNQASAADDAGAARELVLHMPGVCTQDLADTIAARELSFRSRPITKCRAIVDRTFLRRMPGDVVALTWPEYGISGQLFRVANAVRGTLEDGKLALDLIQDESYAHRYQIITPPVGAFPGQAVIDP